MTQEISQELLQRLDAVALKFGATGEALWEIGIRQARILLFQMGIGWAVIFTLVGLLIWAAKKYDIDGELVIIIGGIIGLVAIVLLVFTVDYGMTAIFNPEYLAWKVLLK